MRKQLLKIARLAAPGSESELRAAVKALGKARGGHWQLYAGRFIEFLDTGTPRFTIFARGNGKLPFFAFSALPIVTCPGFGACGKWCYSFKAWRYPAAFFRQLQNTFLLFREKGRATLTRAFSKLPQGVDFRLYVDGDFDSLQTMHFWFANIELRPDVRAYGYSKSWALFLEYSRQNSFPANYKLNLSGGSRYGEKELAAMEKLDCVRGQFVAVPVKTREKVNRAKYRREVAAAAREAGHARVFVCPGKCGDCVRGGTHACGSSKFDGVAIAIGIH